MTRCMAGIGAMLRVGTAEAAQGEVAVAPDHQVATVEVLGSVDWDRVKIYVLTMVIVVGTFYEFIKFFKIHKEKCKQARSKEVGCQYALRDVVQDAAEKQTIEKQYYEMFDGMTITSAKKYLHSRGFSSPSSKHEVNMACVKVRMMEISSGTDDSNKYDSIFRDCYVGLRR